MARDCAAYAAEITTKTGRTNTAFSTLIYEWLNDLFEKVQTDPEKLWFLDKTVQFTLGVADIGANGAILDVPADFEDGYNLFIVDTTLGAYTEIRPISDRDAKLKYGPSDTGQPERVSVEGQSLRFWPPQPDQTYTLELSYKSKLTRVSVTTDTNDFMDSYHSIVINGLLALAWEYLQQYEKATYFWNLWEKGWMDLRASNVARVLAGEQKFVPLADAAASTEDERGGTKLTWGGY